MLNSKRFSELAVDNLCIAGFDGYFKELNPAWENTLGYSLEELKAHPFVEFVHPDDVEKMTEIAAELAKETGHLTRFENRYRCSDGSYRWLSWNSRVDFEAQVMYGVARDVTEEKQRDSRLRRYEHMVASTKDLMAFLDRDFRYQQVNDSFLNYWNRSRESIVGATISDLMGEKRFHQDLKPHLDLCLEGNTVRFREWFEYPGYGRRFMDVAYSPAQSEEGRVEGIVVSVRDMTELMVAQEALQEARSLARNTVDSLSANIAIVDETGTIIAVNDAWRAFARENGADITTVFEGANYFQAIENARGSSDESWAREFETGIRAVLDGETASFVLEYPCHSPTEKRWFSGRVFPFRGTAHDGLVRVVIAHEDITERVVAERKARAKNRELSLMNEIISLAATRSDIDAVLQRACDGLADYTGVPRVIALLLDREKSEARVAAGRLPAAESRLLQSRHPFDPAEIQSAEPAQRPRAIEGVARSILPATEKREIRYVGLHIQGEPAGYLCFIGASQQPLSVDHVALLNRVASVLSQTLERNMLHQRLTQYSADLENQVADRTRELEQLNHQFAAILDSTDDSIVVMSEDGRLESTNAAFKSVFGYDDQALVAIVATDLVADGERERVTSIVKEVVSTQRSSRLRTQALRRDGTSFEAELTIAPVLNNGNHLVCTVHNIDHFKEVEKLKNQFVSTVNHELRNPIAGILLIADILTKYYDQQTDDQRQRKLEQIRQQAQQLSELVSAILDLSRIEEQRERPDDERVETTTLVESIVEELRSKANRKRQDFRLHVSEEVPAIQGKRSDVALIWRNLLDNALKYTPEGGQISARVGVSGTALPGVAFAQGAYGEPPLAELAPGRFLVGQVQDTGFGMSDDDLAKLFTRFHRGWADQSDIPGTGLGLSLVRELLTLYGGDIHVASKAGTGSTFTFWMPLQRQGARA